MGKKIIFWVFLSMQGALFAQAPKYPRNKNAKIIKLDTDLKGLQLETKAGQKINSFPHEMNKNKGERSFLIWPTGKDKQEVLIESDFVENIFVTDALKNCPDCMLKFEGNPGVYERRDVYINLKNLRVNSKKKEKVRILDPQFNITEGTFIGKKLHTVYRAVGETQMYDPVFGSKNKFTGLVQQYLGTSESSFIEPKVFDRKLKDVQSSQNYVWLQPNVSSYHFFIWKEEYKSLQDNPDKTGISRYHSTGDVSIQWKFMGANNEVAFVISTRAVASSKISDPTLLFEHMVKESIGSLLSHDSLSHWIEKTNQKLIEKFGKNGLILVRKPITKIETSKALVKEVTPAVVTVYNEDIESFGSGFLISESGHIVTNHHVIESAGKIKVQFYKDSTKYDATILQVDEDIDLALLKVNRKGLTYLNFGNSEEAEIGETVYAVGTPSETKLSQSVSKGIISGKREWEGKSYLQTDVSINFGNSGGPLVNEKGEVVGIVALKMVGRDVEGLSFVIPSNTAMEKLGLSYK